MAAAAMATPAPRVVLVTGCSSGIGLALAVRLAQDPQQRFHGEHGAGGGGARPLG